MTDPFPVSWVRYLTTVLNLMTVYAAPCFSMGALGVALRKPLDLGAGWAFVLGTFVAVGPVYLFYGSEWGMHRTLESLKAWRDEGLIDQVRYDHMVDKAVAWFEAKRWG